MGGYRFTMPIKKSVQPSTNLSESEEISNEPTETFININVSVACFRQHGLLGKQGQHFEIDIETRDLY